jgi:4-hydroxy-2-oxoheptanedioate aldolase
MSLVDDLKSGRPIVSAWSVVPDTLTVELLSGQGFDAVTLDMQHGGHNEDSVLRSIPAITRAARPALVRIPVGRFDMASRALDFGAEAVIAPMVNSAEDARRFAAAMKYPPLGERSWGPTYANPRAGGPDPKSWLRDGNARTVSFAMIETRTALDALDAILDTPGIDAVFVGPSDFSLTWTGGASIDPLLEDMMGAIEDIASRARGAGKHAGIYIMDPATSGRFVSMGYQLLATGSELQLFRIGGASLLGSIRSSIG